MTHEKLSCKTSADAICVCVCFGCSNGMSEWVEHYESNRIECTVVCVRGFCNNWILFAVFFFVFCFDNFKLAFYCALLSLPPTLSAPHSPIAYLKRHTKEKKTIEREKETSISQYRTRCDVYLLSPSVETLNARRSCTGWLLAVSQPLARARVAWNRKTLAINETTTMTTATTTTTTTTITWWAPHTRTLLEHAKHLLSTPIRMYFYRRIRTRKKNCSKKPEWQQQQQQNCYNTAAMRFATRFVDTIR